MDKFCHFKAYTQAKEKIDPVTGSKLKGSFHNLLVIVIDERGVAVSVDGTIPDTKLESGASPGF